MSGAGAAPPCHCPECGQRLAKGALFCPGCGAELPGYAERFHRRDPPPLPSFYERIPIQGRAAVRMVLAILAALFASIPVAWMTGLGNSETLLVADLLLAGVVTLCALPERRMLRDLFRRPAWGMWLAGAGGALVLLLAAGLYLDLLHALGLPVGDTGPDPFSGSSLPVRLLSLCLVPGVFEELAFRGVVLGVTRSMMTRSRAHLLTAFLFAALHFSPLIFPYHFLVGLFLGWLRERSGSLWPSMATHSIHNGLVMMGL